MLITKNTTLLALFFAPFCVLLPQTSMPEEKQKAFAKNADAYELQFASFNSEKNDFCATYFMDAIVFTSSRNRPWFNKKDASGNGYAHLYTTEKNANGKYLKPKIFMADLHTSYNDGPISFTKDFSAVYFTRIQLKKSARSKDGGYKMKMYCATLNRNGFDSVASMPFNNNEYDVAHPSLSSDGNTLFFASDMPGGIGGMDIYMSKKTNAGWGSPINLGDKINTASDEVFPFIAADNKLYFSSAGHDGMGGLDIYETKIKNDKAEKPFNMGLPVNSAKDDFGIFLGSDSRTGFISSDRKEGETLDDLYHLKILREVKRGKEMTLIVKNKYTGKALPGTSLIVNNDTVVTNDNGEYLFVLEDGAECRVQIRKNDFFPLDETMASSSFADDTFTKELLLEEDPKLTLVASVKDTKTGLLVEGATLKLKDSVSNALMEDFHYFDGDYHKKLADKKIGDKLNYLLTIEKSGYLTKTVKFNYTISKPGEIKINEQTDLSIGKVEIGMDLAKMIDIKPIYFDLGKSLIRKDAALELDKVVEIMKMYPNMYIELGSHTDCRSSAASNLKLSTARAKASAAYIVKKGINKAHIVGKGYGETKLLNDCTCEGKKTSSCPEEEHTKNRRTEFLITRLQ